MIKKETYLVISFDSTTRALHMEKTAKEDNVPGRIIPLPKEIDAGCGLAWATRELDENYWRDYLKKGAIKYNSITILEL